MPAYILERSVPFGDMSKNTDTCGIVFQILALAIPYGLPRVRAGNAPGLALIGDVGQPPQLIFGGADLSTAPSLSMFEEPSDNLWPKLELKRGDTTRASFAADVATLPHLIAGGDFAVSTLSSGGIPQWRLWDLDTFDVNDSGDWSIHDKSFCGVPEDQFLGGHCKFAATTTMRRYQNLPPHTRIRIKARVHFFDDWDGESLILQVDSTPMWAQSHKWCSGILEWKCRKFGMDSCGKQTPDKLSVLAKVELAHISQSIDVAFTSNMPLNTDACTKSWGVDDVSIELL